MYLFFKHLHMSLAMLSLLGFIVRSIWAFTGSNLLNKKVVKVLPHIIDTFLLISAIVLVVMIGIYPFTASGAWITAKVIALFFYIGFGTMTIKRAKSQTQRAVFFVLAIATFIFIFATARLHAIPGL